MGLMMLAAGNGSDIHVSASGPQARAGARRARGSDLTDKFGEGE